MTVKPWPQLLGAHPIDACGTGVLLDASERLGEIPAGQHKLPQIHPGGVSGGAIRRRVVAALWPGVLGLHLWTLPTRPPKELAAITATTTSTNVLTLGFAFSPSQRSRSPLVLRRLLTSPRRAAPSRAPPSRTTPRTTRDRASGTPMETSTNKTSNLHRTPIAFTDRPLDGHRASPRGSRLARTDPPYTRSLPNPNSRHDRPCVPRVATSHSGFLPTQPHD